MPHDYPLEMLEPGLEEQAYYDPVNFTFPGGAHIAEVEIDPETGIVKLVNYTAVDDVGTVINPMIVEGQLHGGIVQGIGQALFENCVYDDVVRPAPVGLVHGLLHAAGRQPAEHDGGDPQHAVHAHSDGREGLRRSRHDRLAGGRHQRGGRCARRISASATSTCRRCQTESGVSSATARSRKRPNRRNCLPLSRTPTSRRLT